MRKNSSGKKTSKTYLTKRKKKGMGPKHFDIQYKMTSLGTTGLNKVYSRLCKYGQT